MYFIDTHSHIYAEEFDTDRKEVVQRALQMGIQRIFLPNVDSASIPRMLKLEEEFPENCFAMMGLHPCSVKEDYRQELQLVEHWLSRRSFCAVGEIGMDLYWDKTFVKEQAEALEIQLQLALQYKLPVVIHSRNSFAEIMDVMRCQKELPHGIFHCFSGTLEEAEEILNLGNFKLGIGGVLSYKNAGLDKVVEQLSLDDLVLETDAPYLPPVPHRGKRNESSYLFIVARKLAELKGVSLETVANVTSRNAMLVFSPQTQHI